MIPSSRIRGGRGGTDAVQVEDLLGGSPRHVSHDQLLAATMAHRDHRTGDHAHAGGKALTPTNHIVAERYRSARVLRRPNRHQMTRPDVFGDTPRLR